MKHRSVLITGGTGFLGSALVRYALAHDAKVVVAYAHTEESLRRLKADMPDARLQCYLGDVRDEGALHIAARVFAIDSVIHTAALKHVPTCEQFPLEAVKTNVDGTAHVIAVAQDLKIQDVVAISSDKAVQPTSVYGATKALLERLMVASHFACVRCGNLIGSTGSVLPVWRAQVARGGPIMVTDPAMTRFYVALSTIVPFIARVLCEGAGGLIYVPKLRACSVGDLADAVCGMQHVIGPRAGERTHEVLLTPDEPVRDLGWAYVVGADAPVFGQSYCSNLVAQIPPHEVLACG